MTSPPSPRKTDPQPRGPAPDHHPREERTITKPETPDGYPNEERRDPKMPPKTDPKPMPEPTKKGN